jgi:hypothetical protein
MKGSHADIAVRIDFAAFLRSCRLRTGLACTVTRHSTQPGSCEGFDAKDFLERNKKARTVHCRRCNRTCDQNEMAALNTGAVFWEHVRHRKRPKHLDAEYTYRHGTNWDTPDWSSSNERLPADLAAAKQSVQQEEKVKAALKASTDALPAQAKREKQQQRQQRRRQVVDAANGEGHHVAVIGSAA